MKAPLVESALRDDNGLGDIAFISLGALMLATVGPILFMCAMSAVAHFRCSPHEVVVKDAITVIACPYDPQPLGTAIGYACGGFGVALGALAAYMAATRRPQGSSTTTTRTQETVTAGAPAAPAMPTAAAVAAAAAAPPINVAVVDQAKPIEVDMVDTPKRPTDAKPTKKGKPRGKTH